MLLHLFFSSLSPSGPEGRGPTFNFALTMLIFGLLTKVFPDPPHLCVSPYFFFQLASLYSSSHFFSAIGGAYSMESSMGQSAYDALGLPPLSPLLISLPPAFNSNSAYHPESQYSPPPNQRPRGQRSSSSQRLRRGLQSSDEEADDEQDGTPPLPPSPLYFPFHLSV
jgi:hypothetical protein